MPQTNIVLQKVLLISLILVGTGITVWLISKVLNNWGKKLTNKTKSNLDNALLNAVRVPAIWAVVLTGLWLSLQQAVEFISINPATTKTIFFLIYWFLGYLLSYRLIVNLAQWYRLEIAHQTETTLDEQIIPFLQRILILIVSIIAIIVLLGHFNVNTSTISAFITTLGIGSLAIALAAQTTLGDIFSGFAIMIDRPFRIGDRIELIELNTWGDVIDIGFRSTRILTRDNRFVVIPNSIIGKNLIVNHSIPSSKYRVQTHIEVAYGVDVDYVRNILTKAVAEQDWVMANERIEALFLSFEASGLQFRVRCWIEHYMETRRVLDKLNSCLYKALHEADIEIPFPQRVIHISNNSKEIH